MKKTFCCVVLVVFFVCISFAENKQQKTDSLRTLLNKTKVDSVRARIFNEIILIFSSLRKSDSVLFYGKKAISEQTNAISSKHKLVPYYSLGNYFRIKEKYDESAKYLLNALRFSEQDGEYLYRPKIFNALGDVYWYVGDKLKSEEYYKKALEINKINNNQKEIAFSYYNLAWIKDYKKEYQLALDLINKSYAIASKMRDTIMLARVFNTRAGLLSKLGKLKESEEEYVELIKIQKLLKDTNGLGVAYHNISQVFLETGKVDQSLQYALMALEIYKYNGGLDQLRNCVGNLGVMYKTKGDYKKAYEYLTDYINYTDSMNSTSVAGQIAELQTNYQTERKDLEIDLLNKETKLKELELSRQRGFLIISVIILAIVALSAFYIYRAYKQKKLINYELEVKKNEIQDSIRYAFRIQQALLPSKNEIKKLFASGFVFYKPKDIVSGDFYWYASVGNKHLVAVSDCTGHGVPGAFMSTIAVEKLNDCVYDNGLTKPSDILARLNKMIKETLKQDQENSESRDGMDIALCGFDFTTKTLEFAGANRPLLYFRNGILNEITPTKAAIGGFTDKDQLFVNHELKIEKGDTFYMFSDGYADQFGGMSGKKLMVKKFKSLLTNIHTKPMEEQESILHDEFQKWKKDIEQLDDVLVMGIKT